MRRYVFYAEGLNKELSAVAEKQTIARHMVWLKMTEEEKDRVVCLDWIDTQPEDGIDSGGTGVARVPSKRKGEAT